jgi:hypothetical protein
MPTVLYIYGWRFFFYSNEGKEPVHIHAEKGEMECKYWLIEEEDMIEEVFTYNMSTRDKQEVVSIIRNHFHELIASWKYYFKDIQ